MDTFDDRWDDVDLFNLPAERQGEVVKPWDTFKLIHRKPASGSTVETKFIDNGTKFLKVATIFFVAVVVLVTAVVSKGLVLLMTSQVKKDVVRGYCHKEFDTSRTYTFTMPEIERSLFIWLLILAYMVPEAGTFTRSVRILIFKKREYPKTFEFLTLFTSETLSAIGSALLIFGVLPELDVVKGAMLTNAMSFVPAILLIVTNLHWRNRVYCIADLVALTAQATVIIWTLMDKLWLLPVAGLLVSCGWWENFVSEKSPIALFRDISRSRKHFPNSKYFSYAIISVSKSVVFFLTTLLVFYVREGQVTAVLQNFQHIFSNHVMFVNETSPIVAGSTINAATSQAMTHEITSNFTLDICLWLACLTCAYTSYAFSKFSCKIMIQTSSMAFPVALVVPVLVSGLILICGFYARNECSFYGVIPSYLFFNSPQLLTMSEFVIGHLTWLWLLWLLSQIWITRHIWTNKNAKLASTEQLFMRPMYDAFLIDQSIAMNRRNVVDQLAKEDALDEEDVTTVDEDKITRIYACATMWHETPEEMVEFFKSIFRMDEDQCAHRIVRQYLQYPVESHYEWETHIFFDDAFLRKSKDDNDPNINSYVQDLIRTIPEAATEVHHTTVKISPPVIYPTPYGGRLVWTLPGKTKMVVHLKDKAKIRAKKRWSQVMYMYYLLGHRIMDNDDFDEQSVKLRSRNTYIMALDGDIDFQPEAVHLLVQCMKKKDSLGAACGRIHPVGSGAMAWYQVFEYAVGHWMQKATEHVIGCVLCSPGCFSLFRASALMDHNVMARYTTTSSEARHYVQYDQGEDRWLCTLLLQRGWRVEYSAASDAYTHCPEGFNEFYNQRRRWMPSTTANIMDLLEDSEHIKIVNDDISTPYIIYQVVLMIGTVIGPGTIFLMLVGAFVTVFNMSQYDALWYNCIPVLTFSLVCIICKSDTQLLAAAVISGFYGLIMMMVLIGVAMQIHEDGLLAPSSLFFFLMMGEYVVAALVHPKEIYCLKYGIIYLITVPSMYMLLVIYSVFNMNNVSWGTREVTVVPKLAEGEVKAPPKKKQSMVEEYLSKVKEFFMSCRGDSKHLTLISTSLTSIQQRVDQIDQKVTDLENPHNDDVKRKTTIIEGPRPSMRRSTIRKSTIQKPMDFVEEYDDLDDESIASSDGLQNNSWFYDEELIRGHVTFLDNKEETFWKDLLDRYLFPIEDDKEKVAKDLKDLRDKMAMSFFAINILFVVVVFLLTIKKEILHIDWPFNPTVNFTYSSSSNIDEIVVMKTYLELEPIGFVFLIFFFALMAVQFVAMLVHRFGTFSQIMANTDVDFGETKIENMTEDELLQRDPIKTFKKLIKLKGVNGDDEKDEDVDEHVSRRKTVADLKKNKDKKRAVINELDAAFQARMEKIVRGEDTDVPVPRKTIAAIQRRRTTVLHRKSQMPQFNPNAFKDFQSFPSDEGTSPLRHHFDNPAYVEDTEG